MKLYEFLRGMQWAWHHGSKYADELLLAINRWSKEDFSRDEFEDINNRHQRIWSPSKWSASRFFWILPSPFKEILVNWIFRLPTLIIALTGIIILSSNICVLIIGVLLLWIGLWVVTIHSIIYRLTHGYMDNYFARTVSLRMLPYPDPQSNELNPSRRKMMREFAKVFIWLLILVVIGYTGIYTGLSNLLNPNNAFNGVNDGWALPFDLLYFSIVTLATVGFGDVSPNQNAVIVRLAVASQIMIGFFLVVFLLTSFSLTLEPEKIDNEK